MKYALKLYLNILILTAAMSGICSAKDVNNTAQQEETSTLIENNIESITSLSVECIMLEYEGHFKDGENSYLWAIREKHNESCGGDPNTAPIINRVVSVHKSHEEKIELFVLDLECMCLGKKLN
jgi:hypothetical protein